MKKSLTAVFIFMTVFAIFADDAKPVWELGEKSLDPKTVKGKVEMKDGIIKVDGENSLVLPNSVLGDQNDYTIEFEVKRPNDLDRTDKIALVSNMDTEENTGLELLYYPPTYNCGALFINGYMTVEYRGLLDDKFSKITIVAKSKQLMLFRNGLLLATTEQVNPSKLPLVFGGFKTQQTKSFELKNIKIYQSAMLPTGFDPNTKRMRYVSGDEYFMQCVEIENPKLPRILIIGDSISMAYRRYITEYFEGKAYVDYWTIGYKYMGNENSPMERALTGVLSNGPYDVVTFNFGLHYWTKPERSPEDKHIPWMTKLVKHLKKTSPETTFIWIRTTPWRTTPAEGTPTLQTEQNERIIKFNKMTDELMEKEGIPEVDLYAVAEKQLHTVGKGSKDSVHWNGEVSKLFADEINQAIDLELSKKKVK